MGATGETKVKTKEKPSLRGSLHQLEKIEGRSGADTIRLWESFRDQAYLWRALALLQIPATALAIAAALVMYFFADTIIEVPQQPQPGHYSVKQLPDSEFVNVATEIVNSIASYQPTIARAQFLDVRKYLWEPALSEFEETMIKRELRTIEQTSRSQLFYINRDLLRVERFPERDFVVVRVPGRRLKLIGNRPLPTDDLVYYIKMTTIPRNAYNQYGIVITQVRLRKVTAQALESEDASEMRRQRREEAEARNRG